MQKTLGGDRLGAGKKQKVDLHGYERSTHDLGYLWRSTMSAGTLVPFMSEVALPGDTFDIHLDCDVKTHPTIGPLFGSYKVQLDVFQAPIRLYNGQLHNNKLGIGMHMATIALPQFDLQVLEPSEEATGNIDNIQINPSSLLAYLGIRGIGMNNSGETKLRSFNAVPLLAYWEIYKNYYANKQEEIGAQIYTPNNPLVATVDVVGVNGEDISGGPVTVNDYLPCAITYTGAVPLDYQIIIKTSIGEMSVAQCMVFTGIAPAGQKNYTWRYGFTGNCVVNGWRYIKDTELPSQAIQVRTFSLATIDDMRGSILALQAGVFNVNDHLPGADNPYESILDWGTGASPYLGSQQGLGLKTYQSDLFNNWLSTDWIDGPGGINEITAIDTTSGSFAIDTLILAKKVYNMLNRIAVSGGSYDDWLDAVWANDRIQRAESPIYHGGLIKELVFQEVVSNSEASGDAGGNQPLGTLAGKGTMSKKNKGGRIRVSVDEPAYIIGIISLTPRIDYSQGNKWDTHLLTMDDLHKPALDQIGFQETLTEQAAWWDTMWPTGGTEWETRSMGKQPAWINYMTNVNVVRGNFAIEDNEMFMTLNRRYEYDPGTGHIKDLTTYIDPTKYNHIFAQTSLDAQNYWVQIAVDITARRKMSAKVMPNL